MKQLKKLLKGKHTLVFIDFEGTQYSHEIIASGLIKCKIDDECNIIEESNDGLLIYTKPRSMIGKIVTKMTSITEEFIKDNGISWGDTITKISEYIGDDIDDTIFVCFGSNDPKMILESCRYSHPENAIIAKQWLNNFLDIMTFMSQYIRDDNNNTYSLVNFLKLYGVDPVGVSHNPLNDAIDLKNLYKAFLENKDVAFNEYKKLLSRIKTVPTPIKKVIEHLLKGDTVTPEYLDKKIRDYLK